MMTMEHRGYFEKWCAENPRNETPTVVVPTGDIVYSVGIVINLRARGFTGPIVLVHDNFDQRSLPEDWTQAWYDPWARIEELHRQQGDECNVAFLPGAVRDIKDPEQPFNFAKNINIGINYALAHRSNAHVVLMEDDARLTTRGGIEKLDSLARGSGCTAMSAAVDGIAGAGQKVQDFVVTAECNGNIVVACLWISKDYWLAAIENEWPEQFSGYGHDDDAWLVRMRAQGGWLGVTGQVRVGHHLPSVWRNMSIPPEQLHAELQQNSERLDRLRRMVEEDKTNPLWKSRVERLNGRRDKL